MSDVATFLAENKRHFALPTGDLGSLFPSISDAYAQCDLRSTNDTAGKEIVARLVAAGVQATLEMDGPGDDWTYVVRVQKDQFPELLT